MMNTNEKKKPSELHEDDYHQYLLFDSGNNNNTNINNSTTTNNNATNNDNNAANNDNNTFNNNNNKIYDSILLQNDNERLKYERINSRKIPYKNENQMTLLHTAFADQVTSSMKKKLPQTRQQNQQEQQHQQQPVLSYDQPIQKYRFDGNVYYDCSYTDIKTVIDTLQIDKSSRRKGPRGGVAIPFPVRLHIMLENHDNEDSSNQDNEHNIKSIVRWQPHGRSFHITDVKRFVSLVMQR